MEVNNLIKRFYVNGKALDFKVNHMVNAGYAGHDQEIVQAHIDELAAIGVTVPKRVPTFYPVPAQQLTSEDMIQVGHTKTSAEVEYVYLVKGDKAYITIGSDHSDRELETYSVTAAKQICPNVVATELWEYDDVKDHLNELLITCEVYDNGQWREYQKGFVTDILKPDQLIELGREVIGENEEGLILYSGTIPTIGEMIYAPKWRITMTDKHLSKEIKKEYAVEILPDSIE